MKKFFYVLGLSLFTLFFTQSCGKEKENGKEETEAHKITDLDVSAYDKWVYLSFADGTTRTLSYTQPAPEKWDVAFHRDNVKTNGGAALKTEFTELAQVTSAPAEGYREDEMTRDVVIVDMSQMMQGVIVYDTVPVNMELNAWVSRSGMPPVYTVGENVYVVRTKEGKHAKIKFSSYKNAVDKTGFATFEYEYPF